MKDSIEPSQAQGVLTERIDALVNILMDGHTPERIMHTRDTYLTWVEQAETQLADLTHEDMATSLLHTTRYWQIRRLVPHDARPIPLIEGEKRWQLKQLNHLRSDLEARVKRALSNPGHITVLDTNTLLHYQLIDSIKWSEVVERELVRLVIPLRVIEELDAKKYSDKGKLRDRARELLPRLEDLASAGNQPASSSAAISESVSVEVPVDLDSGPRAKPTDADEEILLICCELRQLSGQAGGVTLVTGDSAMRLRALALQGIKPITLPEKYRRDRD